MDDRPLIRKKNRGCEKSLNVTRLVHIQYKIFTNEID